MSKKIPNNIAIGIILLATFLFGSLILIKIIKNSLSGNTPSIPASETINAPEETGIKSETTDGSEDLTPTPEITGDEIAIKSYKEFNDIITINNVAWSKPKKLADLNLVKLYPEASPTIYLNVGKITDGELKNGDIILAEVAPDGISYTEFYYYRFIKFNNEYILLKNYLSEYSGMDYQPIAKTDNISIASGITIKDLSFPSSITGPDGKIYNLLESSITDGNGPIDPEKMVKIFDDPVVGAIYKKPETFIQGSTIFFAKSPDSTEISYQFATSHTQFNAGDILWKNGEKNSDTFIFDSLDSCSESGDYVEAVQNNPAVSLSELIMVGETKTDESIYSLKDKNHPYLKTFPINPEKTDEFSIIFWQDEFGRLIRFVNESPLHACGAKPVIYLYPEKEENIKVSLNLKNGFSVTKPEYSDGWTISAKPTGELTDLKTGKKYPYLFWEGGLTDYRMPEEGFVVKKENIKKFFDEKLSYIGLNTNEINEFTDFWVRRMKQKPFYFITFTINADMDKLAPLSVEPKPDTIIRVLMDFESLDSDIKVQEQKLPQISREGFTVIEWGGVLE